MTDYHARAPRSVRLPADTETRLRELADSRGESVNAQIVRAVRELLERESRCKDPTNRGAQTGS